MKSLVLCCLLIGVFAEPPRYRPRFRLQPQELAPTTTDSPTESTTEPESLATGGPYPSSGWKPAGEPFTLPNEPANTYGTPIPSGPYPPSGWKPSDQAFNLPQDQTSSSYGPPDSIYGTDSTNGTPMDTSTTETTENPLAQKVEGPVEIQKSIGTYYVLLPNGQLQKVEFLTENNIQNMRYTARLELRDRAPLYVFGP